MENSKIDQPNKILISGGWGYSNLGDDAILAATLKLTKSKYPHAEIIVMSFNPEETKEAIHDSSVTVVPAIHIQIGHKGTAKDLGIVDSPAEFKKTTDSGAKLKKTPLSKIQSRFNDVYSLAKYYLFSEFNNLVATEKYFAETDLFIQAGGGYFIEGWPDSALARVLELKIANKYRKRSLVIGQSIGPFNTPRLREIATSGLKHATVLSVRDVDSVAELSSYKLSPILVPDTVLSDSNFAFNKKRIIAIILGSKSLTDSQLDLFHKALGKFSNEGYEVRIMVSRLWEPDLNNAHSLYDRLRAGTKTQVIIPSSHEELQNLLGECSVLVSQNLHGLILAWRAGVPCVSINTKRKFVSFMAQSNQSHRLSSINDLSAEKLTEYIYDAIGEDTAKRDETRHFISNNVRSLFNECLDKAWKSPYQK